MGLDHDLEGQGKATEFQPKLRGRPLSILSQGATWPLLCQGALWPVEEQGQKERHWLKGRAHVQDGDGGPEKENWIYWGTREEMSC